MEKQREYLDLEQAAKLSGLSKMTTWRLVNSVFASDKNKDTNDVKKIEANNPKGWKLIIARDRLEKELGKRNKKQDEKQREILSFGKHDTIPDKRLKQKVKRDSDINDNPYVMAIKALLGQNEQMLQAIQRESELKNIRIGELEERFLTIQDNFIRLLEDGRTKKKPQEVIIPEAPPKPEQKKPKEQGITKQPEVPTESQPIKQKSEPAQPKQGINQQKPPAKNPVIETKKAGWWKRNFGK